jgi:alginate O-acetyltransferase complex protein AlgI
MKKSNKKESKNFFVVALSMIFTYLFVITCWVFFRSEDFSTSLLVLDKMYFNFGQAIEWLYTPLVFIIPVIVISHVFGQINKEKYPVLDIKRPVNQYIILFIIFGLFFLAPVNPAPFIYFQF